jgi:hypothetical protein
MDFLLSDGNDIFPNDLSHSTRPPYGGSKGRKEPWEVVVNTVEEVKM